MAHDGDRAHWLVAVARDRDWREVFRDLKYLEPMFDYEAEDAYLDGLRA